MLTSFNNDPARLKKALEESVYPGQYYLNTPGPGLYVPHMEDPHIRLQKWGGNMMLDTVNLESDLKGMTRNLERGDTIDYKKHQIAQERVPFPSSSPFIMESRSENPAWQFRDQDVSNRRWAYPQLNPQSNIEKPFHENVQSRLLSKDKGTLDDLIMIDRPLPTFNVKDILPLPVENRFAM